MRNINELISIIKGIKLDSVINDKEAEHLQSWVDRNRNLAYEQNQTVLVELIDSFLKDRVIDENKKNIYDWDISSKLMWRDLLFQF